MFVNESNLMIPLENASYACVCDWFNRTEELFKEQGKSLAAEQVQNIIWKKFKKDQDVWKYHEIMRILKSFRPDFFGQIPEKATCPMDNPLTSS